MVNRFFKLFYVVVLLVIGLSLPIYLLNSIQSEDTVITTYRAKCLSNDQYVVLQGSSRYDEFYTFDEIILNDSTYADTKENLNFYCKYYDAIQPHIAAYINSKTPEEIRNANINYFNFEKSVISNVFSYPPLYKLEIVSEEFQPYEVFGPIIDWFTFATLAFVVLQIIRMSYMYIVFNKVVWHPFRRSNKNRN